MSCTADRYAAKPTQATPGSWRVYQAPYSDQIQIRDETEEIVIAALPKREGNVQTRVDARLIAAAPAMRDALEAIVKAFDDMYDGAAMSLGEAKRMDDARAALRAARGEE